MRGNPCMGCTLETGRRAIPNCHMTCEKYLKAKAEHDEMMKKYREEKEARSAVEFGRKWQR